MKDPEAPPTPPPPSSILLSADGRGTGHRPGLISAPHPGGVTGALQWPEGPPPHHHHHHPPPIRSLHHSGDAEGKTRRIEEEEGI